jgi:glycosyltransferase involved in cell wall biosynthesis
MTVKEKPAPDISLVMPCYNEEACLRQTASEVLDAFARAGLELELIMVDNGSRDRTGEIIDRLAAEDRRVVKVVVPENQGYGYGVVCGYTRVTAPLVGHIVADGQVSAQDLVVTCLRARNAQGPAIAKVRRRFRNDSLRRKIISAIYNFGIHFVFGWLGSIDINGVPKIMPREVYAALDLKSKDWFLDPELMIKASYLGVRVLEHDVEGLMRQGGKSNVRAVTIFQFLRNIAACRFGGALREWKKSVTRGAFSPHRAASVPAAGKAPR